MLVIKHKATGQFWNAQDGWGSYADADRFTRHDFDYMDPPADGIVIADDEFLQSVMHLGEITQEAFDNLIREMEKASGACGRFAQAVWLTDATLKETATAWQRFVMRIDDAVVGSIGRIDDVVVAGIMRLDGWVLQVDGWIARRLTPLHWRAESWLRWKIVPQLDRFPSFCWADLVCFAQYPENYDAADLLADTQNAGQCARRGYFPYCGKCEITGVHQATNPDAPCPIPTPDDETGSLPLAAMDGPAFAIIDRNATSCHQEGINGNCGSTCPVFQAGDCDEPEGIPDPLSIYETFDPDAPRLPPTPDDGSGSLPLATLSRDETDDPAVALDDDRGAGSFGLP